MVTKQTTDLDAAEIRFRAERRVGELITAQREKVGLNRGAKSVGLDKTHTHQDERPTLAQAGKPKEIGSSLDPISSRLEALEQRLARLETAERRRRGPRDTEDRALFLAIGSLFGRKWVSTREVFDGAALSDELQQALTAADIDNGQQLGKLLERCEGTSVLEGITLRRGKRRADGWTWQLCGM